MLVGKTVGDPDTWDRMIQEANEVYRGRVHNICMDNCHSHVACALNMMNHEMYGIKNWDMVKLCFLVFFRARLLSFSGFVAQFLPFVILAGVIVLTSII
jgi:hypothetical protein